MTEHLGTPPGTIAWDPFCNNIACPCMEPTIGGACAQHKSDGTNPRCMECGWPEYRHQDTLLSPGEVLKNLLAQRQFTQREAARLTGWSVKHVNQVVNDIMPIRPDFAYALQDKLKIKALPLLMFQTLWDFQQQAAKHPN